MARIPEIKIESEQESAHLRSFGSFPLHFIINLQPPKLRLSVPSRGSGELGAHLFLIHSHTRSLSLCLYYLYAVVIYCPFVYSHSFHITGNHHHITHHAIIIRKSFCSYRSASISSNHEIYVLYIIRPFIVDAIHSIVYSSVHKCNSIIASQMGVVFVNYMHYNTDDYSYLVHASSFVPVNCHLINSFGRMRILHAWNGTLN